jgi:hypothetical protein
MKPCNNNSECVYSKENNTFYCRCLNGAANCDALVNLSGMTATVPPAQPTPSYEYTTTTQVVFKAAAPPTVDISDLAKTVVQSGDKSNQSSDIPKLGFNYENVRREKTNEIYI